MITIIKRNSDGLVVHSGGVTLTDEWVVGSSFYNATYTTANATQEEVVELPEDFFDNCWTYVDGVWTQVQDAPVSLATRYSNIPSVSALQMRRALRRAGLSEAVKAFLATAPEEVVEAWEYATQVERSNPMLVRAAKALNKTDAEVDALFRLAATL
jgi:ribosome-associated toxin RatA of RatAB toxin-antitoxin module